jgi:toxin ParE1/3/4
MRLDWTRPALADLADIGDYIAERNPKAAVDVVARIHAACERLRQFPASGRPGRIAETRELVVSGLPYIAAYTVRDERVMILAVIHGARRWPEEF